MTMTPNWSYESVNQRPELVVLSHLDWDWVWQRPQQLVSRMATSYDVWFFEEPRCRADVDAPRLEVECGDAITTVRLLVPGADSRVDYDDTRAAVYPALAGELLGTPNAMGRVVLAYTPLAMPIADEIGPSALAYDVMDDLTAFRQASPNIKLRHVALLRDADVVFTGGRSLHRKVTTHRSDDVHCFPSGVDCSHYLASRSMRRRVDAPLTAGYVGVIDERVDLELIEELAAQLPDWRIQMVGPVAKLQPDELPVADNIEYRGKVEYSELPGVMAGFDVGLMPFAHNEATRSISPTKTAEYLAAGLPVVSTAIPDVVMDFGHVVSICHDAASFADACRRITDERPTAEDEAVRDRLLERYEWDRIAEQMLRLFDPRDRSLAQAQEVSA
jgi:glycosyltransferase involved in cell wall biosynthesis